MQGTQETPPEVVRETLDEVLAQPGFRTREPSWLDRLHERFFDWLGELLEGSGVTPTTVVWILAIPGILLMLFLIWRIAATRTRVELDEGERARRAVASRVRELFGRAEEANAAGDRVLALRLYFFALVVGLGERGDLEYRDAWTARELLQRGHPGPGVTAILEPELSTVERASFGGARSNEADVSRLRAICIEFLGGLLG